MLLDPARYEGVGGDPRLSLMLEGFKVVPYLYVGTLAELPVPGAYDGDRLFDVEWAEGGLEVASAAPRYTQSLQIVEELFPKDRPIVLMCGGGGYAAMMRALLLHLGWDPANLYNAGGIWDYPGGRLVQLIKYDSQGNAEYLFWRADVATIEFPTLVEL